MDSSKDNIFEAYVKLHEHVRFLHAYWDTFRQLYRSPVEKQSLLNKAIPQFFVLLEKGLLRIIFLMFRQLVEQPVTMGRRNASLRGLLHAIHGSGYRTLHEEALIVAVEKNNTIKEIVNRVVAHIDWNVAVGDDLPPSPVALQDVEDALLNVRLVMQHLATELGQPVLEYRDVHIREEIERLWVLLASSSMQK
jgi:hypothetical protein